MAEVSSYRPDCSNEGLQGNVVGAA